MSASVADLIASTSVPPIAVLSDARCSSTVVFSSPSSLSPCSLRSFSVWYTRVSALLRTSASSRRTAVLLGVGLGVLHHLVDGVLVQARLARDRHRLLLVRGPVLRRDVHDAVGVDVEGDLDLRHAAGRGRQVDELELAERLVELRHLALALQHVDLHRGLHVLGGREHLGAAGGDGGVALDELGHHAALRLDAERERRDVEEQHVLDLALEHAGLHGGADGDDLVGVDALVGLLAGEAGDELGDRGHAGGAADEDHVVDLVLGEAGVLDRLLERACGSAPGDRR